MFCGKCGKQNGDVAKFCAGCGAKLQGNYVEEAENVKEAAVEVKEATEETKSSKTKGKRKGNRIVLIVLVVIAVIVAVACIVILNGRRSCRGTVKQFARAVERMDVEALMEFIPEEVIEERGDYYEDVIERNLDLMQEVYGEEFKLSYKIERMNKQPASVWLDSLFDTSWDFALENVNEKYEQRFDVEITQIASFGVKWNIQYGKKEVERYSPIMLIRVGDFWYFDELNSSLSGVIFELIFD